MTYGCLNPRSTGYAEGLHPLQGCHALAKLGDASTGGATGGAGCPDAAGKPGHHEPGLDPGLRRPGGVGEQPAPHAHALSGETGGPGRLELTTTDVTARRVGLLNERAPLFWTE